VPTLWTPGVFISIGVFGVIAVSLLAASAFLAWWNSATQVLQRFERLCELTKAGDKKALQKLSDASWQDWVHLNPEYAWPRTQAINIGQDALNL